MIVYLAVNRVNQKAYVGQTRLTLGKRIDTHLSKAWYAAKKSYFQAALAKHGVEQFDFAVLETDAADNAEEVWIERLGCITPCGYNVSSGGEGASIRRHLKSEQWRESVTSPEYRAAASARMKQIRASASPELREAWRENAAAPRRGIPSGMTGDRNPSRRPEVREKIRQAKLGKPRPDMAARWRDPEFRRKYLRRATDATAS